MKMQQQACVCWLSIYLCVDLCSALTDLNADKGDLVIIGSSIVKDRLGWRLLRVVRTEISCSVGTAHPDQGIINISLV